MRMFAATTMFLFPLVLTSPGHALEYTGEHAAFIGADLVGRPVSLGGNQVLEIDGVRGLIRDYTDPASPTWVGAFTSNIGLIERGVYQAGIFIGLHSEMFRGATLFDVANPASPVVLSSTFVPYYFTSAVLRGQRLYLTTADWLMGYDLSNPSLPVLISIQTLGVYPGHRWPSLQGNLLYLLDGADRLRVFDLAAAGAPTDLGTIALPTTRLDALAVGQGYLYGLQSSPEGTDLVTYDLSTPLAPVLVDRFNLTTDPAVTATDLVVTDDVLYASTSADRLRAFSIASPRHPVPGFELPCGPHTVAVTENALLLFEDDDRLRVLERTRFDQPPALIAERQALPNLSELETNGEISVGVVAESGDLLFIDLADPHSPAVIARWAGVNAREVAIHGHLVVACSLVGLLVVDVTDPHHPVQIALPRYPSPAIAVRDCALTDGLFVVGVSPAGTLLYDMSDPTAPRLRFTMRQIHGKLELAGDRLLTINGANRASLYDLSDPDNPQWMSVAPPFGVRDVALSQGHVALLTTNGLFIYQANGFGDYAELSHTPVFNAARLISEGDRIYTFDSRTVHIVDVADPQQPELVGWFEGDSTIFYVAAKDGLIHTDMGLNSYLVRDQTWATASAPAAPPPAAATLLAPAPNPFNPAVTIAFEVGQARHLRLTVHDLRGRLVARLADGTFAAGDTT